MRSEESKSATCRSDRLNKFRMQCFASSQRFGVEMAAILQFETFEAEGPSQDQKV